VVSGHAVIVIKGTFFLWTFFFQPFPKWLRLLHEHDKLQLGLHFTCFSNVSLIDIPPFLAARSVLTVYYQYGMNQLHTWSTSSYCLCQHAWLLISSYCMSSILCWYCSNQLLSSLSACT
jgi:hypothetical protein